MGCCLSSADSISDARKACRDSLFETVTGQIIGRSDRPTLLEAIPTIGKTTAAAQFAAELCEGDRDTKLTYLTHRRANREQFVDMVRRFVSDTSSVDATHLPVLEEDCPTAKGEHGDTWQARLLTLRDQGLSPSALHRNYQLGLPCGGRDCPYMDFWETEDVDPLIVGHLSHAYVPTIVNDRVVIIDEDPGDAYQRRFDAGDLHALVREFFDNRDLPASDLDTLKLLREGGDSFEEARETVYDEAQETDRFDLSQQIMKGGQGHVDAAIIVQALLEQEVDDTENKDQYRVVLSNGVEHMRLSDSIVCAYDPESGEFALRQTPEFGDAAAVVGLDGTPTTELWEGRLGVNEIEHVQVLCDECRQEYLTDILGYKLVQTSPYVKPYSGASAKRISFEKDRGLIHEVDRRADGDIGVITTKRAKDQLLSYDDENEVDLSRELVNHYRNIKGSNEFAGDEVQVGLIIGSPHPGPDELRLVAGLNGDAFDTERITETRDGHHYTRREAIPEATPYLRHAREYSVAQAVLRFGREQGAVVCIHTSALPEWMQAICDEAEVEVRSAGEQAVIQALRDEEKGTTADIAEQTNVSQDTTRNHLQELERQNLVERKGTSHRIIWEAQRELYRVSPTVNITFPTDIF